MRKRSKVTKYLSYEQLRSELFPSLVDNEKAEKIRRDAESYGVRLADNAIDQMLPKDTRSNLTNT